MNDQKTNSVLSTSCTDSRFSSILDQTCNLRDMSLSIHQSISFKFDELLGQNSKEDDLPEKKEPNSWIEKVLCEIAETRKLLEGISDRLDTL